MAEAVAVLPVGPSSPRGLNANIWQGHTYCKGDGSDGLLSIGAPFGDLGRGGYIHQEL